MAMAWVFGDVSRLLLLGPVAAMKADGDQD